MPKIKCIFDTKQFAAKPKGREVGQIINRMNDAAETTYSIDEIKDKLVNGYTIRPSYCGAKEDSWVSQQIFMLDIDNEVKLTDKVKLNEFTKINSNKETKVKFLVGGAEHRSYTDILAHCADVGVMPCFIYTSFGHTSEQHKFRLVFVLDKVINNFKTAKKIQYYLMEKIGCADQQCKNLNRIYYSGKGIVYDGGELLRTDAVEEESRNIEVGEVGSQSMIYLSTSNLNNTMDGVHPEDDGNYNIKALRNRDVEYLRNKINNTPIEFENSEEFWSYVYRINMPQLLEIKYYKNFRCIFHKDKNPSASMFQTKEEGNWIYKCHSSSCGLVMNNKQLIEELGNFKSKHRAIQFIKDIFNLSIKETEWSIEQKVNLDDIIENLNLYEFARLCPQANKNIRYVENLFRTLVSVARNNIYGENYSNSEGEAVFFVSLSELARITGVSTQGLGRMSRRVAVLVYHDLIRKLDDSEIPEAMLKKAQAISISRGFDKRVNFYSIPSWVFSQLRKIEEQGVRWKTFGYTTQAVSFELFLRGEGFEVAQKIYPQHKKVRIRKIDKETGEVEDVIRNRGTTRKSDKRVADILRVINKLIDEKGYATDKDIIRRLSNRHQAQLKRMRPQLAEFGLQRLRSNKALKQQHGVKSSGYPFIIIEMEEY